MAIHKGLVVSLPRLLTAVTKAGLAPARMSLLVPRGVPVWLPVCFMPPNAWVTRVQGVSYPHTTEPHSRPLDPQASSWGSAGTRGGPHLGNSCS
eukprot:6416424-Amphidinium_carterae.1